MAALGTQRERLQRLEATYGAIQAQMELAERELRTFTSRMCNDNITLLLLMLISLGATCIAVYRVTEIDATEAGLVGAASGRLRGGWWAQSHVISPLTE